MIHSTKRVPNLSFGCQGWSNHQDQSFFWWNESVKVIEATEVVEAVEVIETAEVIRPGKSLLRTSKYFRFLNSNSLRCFENIFLLVESWNIMLNFSKFYVGGWWGQLMLLFWNLVDETQMSKPPERGRGMHHNPRKYLILLPLRAIYFRSFNYETPCRLTSAEISSHYIKASRALQNEKHLHNPQNLSYFLAVED